MEPNSMLPGSLSTLGRAVKGLVSLLSCFLFFLLLFSQGLRKHLHSSCLDFIWFVSMATSSTSFLFLITWRSIFSSLKWYLIIFSICLKRTLHKTAEGTLRLWTEVNYLWDSIANKENTSFLEFLSSLESQLNYGRKCQKSQVSWVTPLARFL